MPTCRRSCGPHRCRLINFSSNWTLSPESESVSAIPFCYFTHYVDSHYEQLWGLGHMPPRGAAMGTGAHAPHLEQILGLGHMPPTWSSYGDWGTCPPRGAAMGTGAHAPHVEQLWGLGHMPSSHLEVVQFGNLCLHTMCPKKMRLA